MKANKNLEPISEEKIVEIIEPAKVETTIKSEKKVQKKTKEPKNVNNEKVEKPTKKEKKPCGFCIFWKKIFTRCKSCCSKCRKSLCQTTKNIANKNINYNKHYWIFFTAPLILILAAIIVFACCSFNFTFSFTGGKIISVDYAITMTEEEYQTKQDKVSSIISDNGIKNYTVQKMGEDGDYSSMIKVITSRTNKVSDETIDKIIADITAEYRTDSLGFKITTTTSDAFVGNKVIYNFAIALAIILVVYLLYIWYRYNFASALSTIIGVLLAVLMTTAFTIICRIPTDEYFIAVLLAVVLFIMFTAIFKFGKTEEKLISDKDISNSELMNIVRKETMPINALVYLCLFAIIGILLIFGTNQIRFVMLQLFIGLISCAYVNIVILGSSWVKIYNRRKDKRLIERKKKQSNEDE